MLRRHEHGEVSREIPCGRSSNRVANVSGGGHNVCTRSTLNTREEQGNDDATKTEMQQPVPRVAVIGTGTMGTAMALRLLGAGMEVDVWSRRAASTTPSVVAGATSHDDASDAVKRADVIITMLPNAEITADLMIGDDVLAALPAESTWVQMATIGADAVEQLASETRTKQPGVTFVDAPVSGSRDPAEHGQLLIWRQGRPQLRRRSSRSSGRWVEPPSGSVPPVPGVG